MSILPKALSVASTIASMSDSTETSALMYVAIPRVSWMSRRVSWPPSMSMSAMATSAPSSAKRWQIARPIPDEPPVTIATLSFSLMSGLRAAF